MTAQHELPAPYAGPPLRIAYVSNTKYPWCTEVHMGSSLKALGHHVHYLQEDELDWSTVPALVEREGIQLLLWTRTWPAEMVVVLPVLKELEARGVVSASVHLDRWFGLDRQHQVDDQPFFRTSLVVSPDDSPKWAEHGVNHFWLPPGVYGPECEPVPPNPRRWPYDVVFVGSHPYPHPEWSKYRTDLLSAFRAGFGRRFAILPRERRGTPIRGRDLQELYATVPVVLGDSCLAGESTMYASDRVTESLGRGACLIHPFVDGLIGKSGPWWIADDWVAADDHEIDLFGYHLGAFGDAVAMARWAVANPEKAREIGEHGRATVLARDTYAHRMGTVLAVAEGIHGGYREAQTPPSRSQGALLDSTPEEAEQVPTNVHPVLPDIEVDITPDLSAWPPPSLRVKLNRWSAVFEPRPDTTDAEVCEEVWGRNDYRVPPEGFSGTVVDIGANVGAFSVLAAKAGAKVVYAVEPEAANARRLDGHVRANDVQPVVSIINMAMTGTMTTVRMLGTGGGARTLPAGNEAGIATITLEWMLGTYGPVEFLKCDIEGGEYEAFAACPAEVLAAVRTIALEFHGPGMPHLSHLDDDGKHLERWGALVAKLADAGRVETFGHPMRGGLIWWKRYGA